MNGAFYIGAAGLEAQQTGLDIVANNVTNINTNGFKRSAVQFAELVDAPSDPSNTNAPVAPVVVRSFNGVMASASPRIYDQGTLSQTGNTLDLAISGNGFIQVLGPSGQNYLWRGGTLQVGPNGELETSGGLVLKSNITVPANASSLTIDLSGNVSAMVPGTANPVTLGTIALVAPKDVNSLQAVNGGYFLVTGDANDGVTPIELTTNPQSNFVQGALETSNVNLSTEMVNMMLLQRSYAASAQVVQAGDQLMAIANGLRR